jgi:hypothetical protein
VSGAASDHRGIIDAYGLIREASLTQRRSRSATDKLPSLTLSLDAAADGGDKDCSARACHPLIWLTEKEDLP